MAFSTKEQCIDALTFAGFTLIPLRGKIPSEKNWTETPYGKYTASDFNGGNYGVALKPGDLVIDVDPRNGGDRSLEKLESIIGRLPATFQVKTGGDGDHLYYTKPADLLVCHTVRAFPGLEFKTAGRQVVGPKSVHPGTGKSYEVIDGTPGQVTPAPQALLDLIKRTAVPYEELSGLGEYKNDAPTQAQYVAYLQDVAQPSVMGQGGDDNAFKVAARGHDLGLPPAKTLELMLEYWDERCQPPWGEAELKLKVINAYKFAGKPLGNAHPANDFTTLPQPGSNVLAGNEKTGNQEAEGQKISWVFKGKSKTLLSCFKNLLNFFNLPETGLPGIFGFNEFTGNVEFLAPAPWHKGRMPHHLGVGDRDLKLLKVHLTNKYAFERAVGEIEEAVTGAAEHHKFHPVRDWLGSLKWDGKSRLESWLQDFCGAKDSGYARACCRKVLSAAVRRVFRPGCKFDHVLVLEGRQKIGKSAVCKILGGKWASDTRVDPHDKDTIQLMQGRWVIELPELEVARRTENNALKAFITRDEDRARLAYGRMVGNFQRQSIFIATVNPEADGSYLTDGTGNRRWWPVEVMPNGGLVDFVGLTAARDQLFAEVMARGLYETENLYMDTSALDAEAEGIVGTRHAEDPWTERIANWLKGVPADRKYVTGREIFIDAMGGVEKQYDRKSQLSVSRVMRSLGWEYASPWVDGVQVRSWYRPFVAAEIKTEN